MFFVNMKLNLNEFKKLYVRERISDSKYELLSSDKANGDVYKITGFGSLDSNGYEHGFLYLKSGSSILEHLHKNDIEIYRYISGDKINDNICLLGNRHKIDSVKGDTIIETFKLNKNIINMDFDIDTLNNCLRIQALRYLWRIDELLVMLAYNPDDLCYSSFEDLSRNYQLSIDSIKSMFKIYFYKNDYLPYVEVPINIKDIGIQYDDNSYVVEDAWQYELVKFNPRGINDIRTKNKSLVKSRNL